MPTDFLLDSRKLCAFSGSYILNKIVVHCDSIGFSIVSVKCNAVWDWNESLLIAILALQLSR
jgi:hypothetical protein